MPIPLPIAEASWTMQLVTSGGVLGMSLLVVLLLLSLAALALAVEQFATLRTARLAPAGVASRVRQLLESGDLPAAQKACAENGMLGAVLTAALNEAAEFAALSRQEGVGPAWPAVEKAMEDAADAEAARLLRRIDYLAVIGNLAPMVGLLGTVVGMIFAFREVAATQGAATAGELASGIYQALVTTVGGLMVAIPSLGVFAILKNRVDAIAAVVVAEAESATRPLKRALSTTSPLRMQPPQPPQETAPPSIPPRVV